MKHSTRKSLLIWITMFGALPAMAQTLTSTFQFSASGTVGSRAFSNAAVTITTVGNSSNREPTGDYQPGYRIINDSASVQISGVGTFQFTVPIFTLVVTPGNVAPGTGNTWFGLGNAQKQNFSTNGSLLVLPLSGFNPWAMRSSIGPLQIASYLTWDPQSITTTGGILNFFDGNPLVTFSAVFSNTVSPPILTRSGVLSHIAANGGWTTVITLVNNSAVSVPVRVDLHKDDGGSLALPVTTLHEGISTTTSTSSVAVTMSPRATLLISMGDPGASTVTGWADVLSSGSMGGYAIFRFSQSQQASASEGTVPLVTQFSSSLTIPYDNTTGFVMGMAMASLSTSTAVITATTWDDRGIQLGAQTFTIGSNGHTAFVMPDQLSISAGRRGVVKFQSNLSEGIVGLGLRFSPFATFTSVPPF